MGTTILGVIPRFPKKPGFSNNSFLLSLCISNKKTTFYREVVQNLGILGFTSVYKGFTRVPLGVTLGCC